MRTSFQFDMVPWKLVICDLGATACIGKGELIYIGELPEAPEPGRIPAGADHVHIVAKYSGERDAREEEKWRSLVKANARCVHGNLMGTPCTACPGGRSPDRTGEWVGTTSRGKLVQVPSFNDLDDIRAWISD